MNNYKNIQLNEKKNKISKLNIIHLIISESLKYYRDQDGFIYKKSNENAQTVYLDCFNGPSCIAGARIMKQTGEVIKFSNHSDEKPDEHVVLKIIFEANLMSEVRRPENNAISVLNLYKRSLALNRGIWLPIDHKSTFLAKLRRVRKYEKSKKENMQIRTVVAATADVATSPMHISSPKTPMQLRTQQLATFVSASTSPMPLKSPNIPQQEPKQNSPISVCAATSPMPLKFPNTPQKKPEENAPNTVSAVTSPIPLQSPNAPQQELKENSPATVSAVTSPMPSRSQNRTISHSKSVDCLQEKLANISLGLCPRSHSAPVKRTTMPTKASEPIQLIPSAKATQNSPASLTVSISSMSLSSPNTPQQISNSPIVPTTTPIPSHLSDPEIPLRLRLRSALKNKGQGTAEATPYTQIKIDLDLKGNATPTCLISKMQVSLNTLIIFEMNLLRF